MSRAALLMLGLALALSAGGCAAPPGTTTRGSIAPGEYARVFDAARVALDELRFDLDRVDARAGVITTRPKPTAGLATPWDLEQTSPVSEFDDLFNAHERVVRIRFFDPGADPEVERVSPLAARAPVEPPPASSEDSDASPDASDDLRTSNSPLAFEVDAILLRRHRPGWRPNSGSVFRSTFAHDPSLARRQMTPRFDEPYDLDEELARRLTARIEHLMRER